MPLTDAEVIATRDDREMLLRPHLWPIKSPVAVFVKRSDGRKGHTGPCTLDGGEFVVREHDWTQNGKVTFRRYADVDAMLADGWIVD